MNACAKLKFQNMRTIPVSIFFHRDDFSSNKREHPMYIDIL